LRAGVGAGHHLSVARCRLSWGFAALRGLATRRTRTAIGFRPTRRRLLRPSGVRSTGRVRDLSIPNGPPCAFAPLQRHATAAPHRSVTVRRPEDRRATRPAMLPLLGFRALRHFPDRRIRISWTVDPSTVACRVRGLATSFATSTTGPPGARGAGASMGFALQGLPLVASGAPLGVLALLTLPPAPPPEGSESATAAFRALFPQRVRAATRSLPEGRTRSSIPS
jgi:hypothetical protein